MSPTRRFTVCAEPGCPELVREGRGYCKSCRRARAAQRPTKYEQGYDARWQRTRAAFLSEWPLCEEPGCLARATEAHHRDGQGPNGPRGHDHHNLEALCKRHHAMRHARERHAHTATPRATR
jgi:5-methylcytosine-specific restriction protein A